VHQEVSGFHEPRWFVQRLGDIARDPLGIAVNLLRHARGRPKRFRFDSLELQVRTEQAPNPDSRVTLSDATDALGQRRAHLHWELTERDRLTMRVTAEAFDGELRRLGLGELRMAPWLASDECVWPTDLVGGHHHMGTTRMSDDPRTGIVNRECRTHAIDNLYVAGSSVFPTAGYANPTMTLLALAIRLSDHLRAG
jgi:choline dehydrogenase-like flavoprotein